MSEKTAEGAVSLIETLEEKGILHNPDPECEICGEVIVADPRLESFTPYYVEMTEETSASVLEVFLANLKAFLGRNPHENQSYIHKDCLKGDPQ